MALTELTNHSAPGGETGPWRSLLDGGLREHAFEAACQIGQSLGEGNSTATRLRAPPGREWARVSLSDGSAGLGLFFAYLHATRASTAYNRAASRHINGAARAAERLRLTPSFFSGFTGIAWAVTHVGRLSRSQGANDRCRKIDRHLLTYLSGQSRHPSYDLMDGLVGFGVYALERLAYAGARALLKKVVDCLDDLAEHTRCGVTWFTPPSRLVELQRARCPRGYYNLGLAHGVPGVIALLSAAHAVGISGARTRLLRDGAVDWLMAQRLSEGAGSIFPYWSGPGVEQEVSRLAWCYGDAGVGSALLLAARCTGDETLARTATNILLAAAERSRTDASVDTAGVCHGAAGLAHMFNRAYQTTGEEALGNAARYWIAYLLGMRRKGEGIAGFGALETDAAGERVFDPEPGLLGGASGVGLVLLAASSTIEPSWDRILLLSAPRGLTARQ